MKNKSLLLTAFFLMLFSCHKEEQKTPGGSQPTEKPLTLAEVTTWYHAQERSGSTGGLHKTHPDSAEQRTLAAKAGRAFRLAALRPDLSRAEMVWQDGKNGWVVSVGGRPVAGGYAQGYRKLVFFRDTAGQVNARIIEVLPDPYYLGAKGRATTADFTGRALLFDWNYRLISGRVYLHGKMIGRMKPAAADVTPAQSTRLTTGTPNVPLKQGAPTRSGIDNRGMHNLYAAITRDCQWYDNNYIDANGDVVVFSEQICMTEIDDDGGGLMGSGSVTGGDYLGSGGGGGGSVATGPTPSQLPGSDGLKINPKKYMGCFGTLPDVGAKCTVTVYVVEPMAGTSFNIGPNSVGHVAVGLTKQYGNTTITQIVGYYPDASGFSKYSAPSKVVDNSAIGYNVSISYQVIPQEFDKIVNYISDAPANYNLLTFNCTNFVYTACQQAGITLPDPYTSVGFDAAQVMTPGALGSTISDLAGEPNVNTDGGLAPISHGECN